MQQAIIRYALVCMLMSCGTAWGQAETWLSEVENFGSNPGQLRLFTPKNLSANNIKRPLVIVLHGCAQTAEGVAKLTGWNKLAELHNFVVIYPQQRLMNNPNLCFNWFLNNDIEKGKGECESIFQMLQFARNTYDIDSTQVFVTGVSAGAAMALVMAATHPQAIKAAALFAAAAYKSAADPLNNFTDLLGLSTANIKQLAQHVHEQNINYTGAYPSLIIYQGLDDPIVNYKNASAIISQWTSVNACDTLPDVVVKNFENRPDISLIIYKSMDGRQLIKYYEVANLGHQLMIKPGQADHEGGKLGQYGTDKNFHSTYQTAIDFGIVSESK